MAAYAVRMQRTASTTLSVGSVAADATRPRRGKIYDVIVGAEGTVADNPFLWVFQRFTAAGTSTSVTPQPVDPADAATEFDAGQNHTIEPTYVANQIQLTIPLNQRATFRWAAREGKEIVYPATASNGIGVATPTCGLVASTAEVWVDEQ